MISHLKNKPSNQRILDTINQAAKIEFNFLLNGLNIDLVGISPQQVLEVIDKNTKALKTKVCYYKRKLLILYDIYKIIVFNHRYLVHLKKKRKQFKPKSRTKRKMLKILK